MSVNLKVLSVVGSALVLIALAHAPARAAADSRSADCPSVESLDYDTAPSFADSAAVDYPLMARMAQLEGDVVVDVVVLESGIPCNAFMVSAVNPLLNRAATVAALKSRFAPATKNGKPVPGICRVTYGFRFDDPRYERQSWPQPPLTPPLVSELGTTSRKTTRKGVEYLEIQYEGIVISGDMPVSLFREIAAQVAARAGCDNPVQRIRNYLSLPRDWDPQYVRQWEMLGDIGVDIKEYPMGSPQERTRCTYRFYYRDEQFVMSDAVRCLHWD